MKRLEQFAAVMTLVAIAATAIAFGSDGLSTFEIAAIVLIVVCAVAFFLVIFKPREIVLIFSRDNRAEGASLERAEARDVKQIHQLAKQHFGDSVTPPTKIKELLYRNRDIFWVLINNNEGNGTTSIEGYFCIIPLSDALCEKIHANEFDVTRVQKDLIPRQKDPISAVYIGAIVGRSYKAKGRLLGHVIEKAGTLANRSTSNRVYARAASKDGLRLLQKHEFDPVVTERCGVGCLYQKAVEALTGDAAD